MSLEYLDFILRLSRGQYQYIASLLLSPAGEVSEQPIQLDFRGERYNRQLREIEAAIRGLQNVTRGAMSPERQLLEEFGSYLFEAVFSGEIKSRYDTCLAMARQEGKGLRIKLRLEAPDLTVIPWEVAYDKREKHFLTLSAYSPIVRYIELKREVSSLRTSFPLQVLVLTPEARDQPPLNTDREKAKLEEAVRNLVQGSLLEIDFLDGPITLSRLQEALRKKRYHVIHFIGHGAYDCMKERGTLIFTNEDGTGQLVPGERLGILLRDAPTVKLVFLNACEGARGSPRASFTSIASSLVLVGIPAVVAMQFKVTDRAAIQFASAFYLSLVDNYPVDASVAEGRKAIALETNYDTVEWVTPVLYMRAPNGVIFELPPSDLALNQRKRALSKEEEQLDGLFQQGMSYLDSKQFHQALIVFEQIRSISPTYKNINIREIIAYLRAEIVGCQRSVPERSPREETQQVRGERLKDAWQRVRQSVGSWAQGLGRKESRPSAASEVVDWDSVIAKAIDTIGKRLKQPVRLCSWEVIKKKEQVSLILESSDWQKFEAVVDNGGNVLQLTPKSKGMLEWPSLWAPPVPGLQRRCLQCGECGRLLEVILDERGQAKIKCKKCGAYYMVLGDKSCRVDVRCPLCGMVNVVPFDLADKPPSTVTCKLCGHSMELDWRLLK